MKKKIAIIYGGYSSEFIISEKSAATIYANIDSDLYEPILVEITKKSWHAHIRGGVAPIDKNKFTYLLNKEENSFDLAFITIHGTPGEDGKLQSYFDMIDLPYVNSNAFASSLTFNKWACNSFLRDFGVSTAKAILLRNVNDVHPIQIADEIGFPCFVKPNDGGSSFGISKVNTLMEMPEAIAKAFNEGEEVVIESLIQGREITCGLFNDGKELIALPLTEITTDNDFFDFDAKYKGESNETTPALIPDLLADKIKMHAKDIYKRIGLRGIARIDFMVNENEEIYLIEVNTNPGMSDKSIVPQQLTYSGLDIKKVFTNLIQFNI